VLLGATAALAAGRVQAEIPFAGGAFTIPNGNAEVPAMLFRPPGSRILPLLLVAHGDPGFPSYLQSFCSRLAQHDHVVLAVDWTYRMPPPPREGEDREAWGRRVGSYRNWRGDDLAAGRRWIADMGMADTRRTAAIGFCGGGVIASHFAAGERDVVALVLFHTPVRHHGRFHDPDDPRPDVTDISERIDAPVQAHFGLNDRVALAEDGRELEQRLRRRGRRPAFHYYERAGHGFLQSDVPMNSEGTFGYAPEAAALASSRAIAFLNMHLAG
jgi:dienelactone hydrolase